MLARLRLWFFAALVALPFLPAPSLACDCAVFDRAVALRDYPIAFRGRAERIEREGNVEWITFSVIEPWQGVSGTTVRARRNPPNMCTVPTVALHGTYEVFLARDLSISGCNPTHPSQAPSAPSSTR